MGRLEQTEKMKGGDVCSVLQLVKHLTVKCLGCQCKISEYSINCIHVNV